MGRLSGVTGLLQSADNSIEQSDRLTRSAILVHAGSFMSQDGPISFDEDRLQAVVANYNKSINKLSKDYGGFDKIPMGAFMPILDQHEDDSNNRIIGRATSKLSFETRDIPKVGKNVPCICGEVTFLGKDTVDRVKDGRIYHLSIGINESENTLSEISAVIQPAAPGAMLLKKGEDKTKGEKQMGLSKGQLKKLAQMKKSLEKVEKSLSNTKNKLYLTKKSGEITARLSGLVESRKMQPSEFRNLVKMGAVKNLAQMSEKDLSTALMIYESREQPVILAGQVGSTNAPDVSYFGKSIELARKSRLASEIKKDFKKLSGGKVMFKGQDEHDETEMAGEDGAHPVSVGKDEGSVQQNSDITEMAKHHLAKLGHHLAKLGHHLANGDVEGAKEVYSQAQDSHEKLAHCHHMADGNVMPEPDAEMKHMAEYTGDVKSEDYRNNMNDLQSQVDELNTQLARMAGMLSELMGSEEEEGHDLGGEEEPATPMDQEPNLHEETKQDMHPGISTTK